MHGDVIAAARVLYGHAVCDRAGLLRRLLRSSSRADRYRKHTGRIHPFWGDGSLMTAALAMNPVAEPRLSEVDYCDCMAQVFEALVNRGRS